MRHTAAAAITGYIAAMFVLLRRLMLFSFFAMALALAAFAFI